MSADHFITFAYGSNMPTARIKARCPSVRALGVAELLGHELRWHKRSKDKSGKCDIVPTDQPGVSVFGVLFEVARSEKSALDSAEGLGSGYEEVEIEVLDGTGRRTVKAYKATDTDPALRPYTWYRALAVAGAKEHGLPASYLAQMETSPAIQDPDKKRHDKNMALICEASA